MRIQKRYAWPSTTELMVQVLLIQQLLPEDIEASWTTKHNKSYFGYKLSARAEKRYKLIRKIKISTAREHDTLHFEAVIDPSNTSRDIYADKG